MVLYGPNLSLMFLIHFFSYAGVYLAGVLCTSFSNFILRLNILPFDSKLTNTLECKVIPGDLIPVGN